MFREDMIARGKPEYPSINVDPAHLKILMDTMEKVTDDPRGTAHAARIKRPDMSMAGKTGTAQVRRISLRERESGVRKNEELPWRFRDHALFVGYAPIENPRYAISVVVEHGGGGSSVAAPIARDVMIETLERDPARLAPGADVAGLGGPERQGT